MKSLKIYRVFLLLAVLMAGLLFPMKVMAAEPVDLGKTVEFTIRFAQGEDAFAGVEFRLYKVAELDVNGELTLTEAFADSGITLDATDDAGWQAIVDALLAYMEEVNADDAGTKPEPDYRVDTDENGVASFTAATGFYLVEGDTYEGHENGNANVIPVPFLISLPNQNADGSWQYQVGVNGKYIIRYDEEISIEVQKRWKGDEEADRPAQVTVELYANDELYDTVVLDKDNHWKYTWQHLDGKKVYMVKEKDVPQGYVATVEQVGNIFIVTNELEKEESSDPDDPDDPDNPVAEPSAPGTPPAAPGATLPQTGVLWWPVPVLLITGVLLICVGLVRRRGNGNEE